MSETHEGRRRGEDGYQMSCADWTHGRVVEQGPESYFGVVAGQTGAGIAWPVERREGELCRTELSLRVWLEEFSPRGGYWGVRKC